MRTRRRLAVAFASAVFLTALASCASTTTEDADRDLDRALRRLVSHTGGPPGAIAVVHRGGRSLVHRAGVGDTATGAGPALTDHMRLASTSKALNGAVALSLVERRTLSLEDTIGSRLGGQGLPGAWSPITLAQALHHTSGLPDYARSPGFVADFGSDPSRQLDSRRLWAYVANEPLRFPPGTAYNYSNTDNVIVALMAEAAAGDPYEQLLQERVYRPLAMRATNLPSDAQLPHPFIHGYVVDPPARPQDISEAVSGSAPWASGGIVSTPADFGTFARGYIGARLFSRQVQHQQMAWVDGNSDYPGPGKNSAGLAVFRYETRCGTMYGHTGTLPGYAQFFASTLDGTRSVTVSVNEAVDEKQKPEIMEELRRVDETAVCAALAG